VTIKVSLINWRSIDALAVQNGGTNNSMTITASNTVAGGGNVAATIPASLLKYGVIELPADSGKMMQFKFERIP